MVNDLLASEFEKDLKAVLRDVREARDELIGLLTTIEERDLERGRRGSWTVRQILEHVIYSEHYFAGVIMEVRTSGSVEPELPSIVIRSLQEAVRLLEDSQNALVAAVDAVDEEAFYRFARYGGLDYSVLSALENAASHDREHASQIRETLTRIA
jgi:uncharacterized damage-inducible protein DinB